MLIFNTKCLIKSIQCVFPILETYFPWLAFRLSCFIFLRPFRFKLSQKEYEARLEAEIDELIVENQKIQVYSWGEGPYLLFVHGWSGRGTNLWPFIQKLNQSGGRLVAFDAQAHGFSEGNKTNLLSFVRVIDQIQKYYGFASGYIGHSLGGMAIYHFHEKNQLDVPIIMIGSPSEETDIFETFFRRLHGNGKSKGQLRDWVAKTTGFEFDKELPLYHRPLLNPSNLLLIHDIGDNDCSVEDSKKLHESNSGSTLMITEGLGHINILKDSKVIETSINFFWTKRKNIQG